MLPRREAESEAEVLICRFDNSRLGKLLAAFAVAGARQLRLDAVSGGPTMQPREAVPLWVGLTLRLIIVGAVMYLTGYFVLEDFLALMTNAIRRLVELGLKVKK
jgi:hypothetical protein